MQETQDSDGRGDKGSQNSEQSEEPRGIPIQGPLPVVTSGTSGSTLVSQLPVAQQSQDIDVEQPQGAYLMLGDIRYTLQEVREVQPFPGSDQSQSSTSPSPQTSLLEPFPAYVDPFDLVLRLGDVGYYRPGTVPRVGYVEYHRPNRHQPLILPLHPSSGDSSSKSVRFAPVDKRGSSSTCGHSREQSDDIAHEGDNAVISELPPNEDQPQAEETNVPNQLPRLTRRRTTNVSHAIPLKESNPSAPSFIAGHGAQLLGSSEGNASRSSVTPVLYMPVERNTQGPSSSVIGRDSLPNDPQEEGSPQAEDGGPQAEDTLQTEDFQN